MSPAKGRLFHLSLVLEGLWPMTYSCTTTLGSLLKGPGQILHPHFLFPATWNGDIMGGTPAPILGLEGTYTIGAMCWNGRAAKWKIQSFTLLKQCTNLRWPAYGLLYRVDNKLHFV